MIESVTFWTFFGISIWIDIITAFVFIFVRKKTYFDDGEIKEVSVLIPVHTESNEIVRETIKSLYEEGYNFKYCIVCGDSYSNGMERLIEKMKKKYPNLIYVDSPECSKAKKINYVIDKYYDEIGDFLYVRDSNVRSKDNVIEDLLSEFKEDKIAAVTSYGYVKKPSNFLGRSYHYGKEWINTIGRFRKNQQEKRDAIFVVCGASTIYRKEVLKEIPVPHITKTEDTHYTWLLQINGYKIRVAKKTEVYSPDVDGKIFSGLRNQIRQTYRWSSGIIQSFYFERSKLNKNKKLLYTTIIPGSIEAITYSVALALLPYFAFYHISFFWGFIIGDTVFSLLATIIFAPRRFLHTVLHYPQIVFYKYVSSLIFLTALIKVTYEKISKKEHRWSNEWTSSG